jgi:magnesium transporter
MPSHNVTKFLKDVVKKVETVFLTSDSVTTALKKLQEKHLDPHIVYFYVVDEEGKLVGVIPTRKLLLCDGNIKISDIMERSIIKLYDDQTLQDAMQFFATYSLLAIPVVDREERLMGAVDVEMYIEESFDIADARHRSDIFQLIGLSLEDEKRVSVWRHYRMRIPWISCSMVGGIICAIISRVHEVVLSEVIILAMFIPLVLTLSESVSMQSMTNALQFIRRPRFSMETAFKKGMKEWQIFGLLGLSSGITVGIISLFWGEGLFASMVIGLGIIVSVAISGTFGLIFPVLIHKTKLDPKIASGPVVLMLADILTTSIYLGLASWWLL